MEVIVRGVIGIAIVCCVIGDHGFRSDHRNLAKMKPYVAAMSLNSPSEDDQ